MNRHFEIYEGERSLSSHEYFWQAAAVWGKSPSTRSVVERFLSDPGYKREIIGKHGLKPTSLEIQVETNDRNLDFEVMQTSELSDGQQLTLSDGIDVTWSAPLKKGAGGAHVFNLLVGPVSGIGIGVLSNWLYDKLKGRSAKLRINRVEVTVDKDQITRVLVEQIDKDS